MADQDQLPQDDIKDDYSYNYSGNISYYNFLDEPASSDYRGYWFDTPKITSSTTYAQMPLSGPGDDSLTGAWTYQNDKMFGSIGDDQLNGGSTNKQGPGQGDDLLVGGDGDDTLVGGQHNDTLYGDYANARVTYNSGGYTEWDVPAAADPNVVGNDNLQGGSGADKLFGGPGNDQLAGGPRGEGNLDELTGGPGADIFYLSYDGADSESVEAGDEFWGEFGQEYAQETGKETSKEAVELLADYAAEEFFETLPGGILLGGITRAVGLAAVDGIKALFGIQKKSPAPEPEKPEDVMIITDFDPREDMLFLPMPTDEGATLSAEAEYVINAPNGMSGWAMLFKATDTTYAQVFLSDDFLAAMGITEDTAAAKGSLEDIFLNQVKIGSSGLQDPDQHYPFPDDPAAYGLPANATDDDLPDATSALPTDLAAPEDTIIHVYGAFGPHLIVGPQDPTLVAGTNLGDIAFVTNNTFAPASWDANTLGTPTTNVMGFDGNDILNGAGGPDTIHGGDGDDTIYGWGTLGTDETFRDQLNGGAGADTLHAAKSLTGNSGADFDGGTGEDTVSFAYSRHGVTADLQSGSGNNAGEDTTAYTFKGVENLTGTAYADQLTGNGASNTLMGGIGDDVIAGGGGDDLLIGGPLQPALYRVAAGGGGVVSEDGGTDWSTDTTDDPSQYLTALADTITGLNPNITLNDVGPGFAPESVVQYYRTDPSELKWAFPVFDDEATYTVNLYFAEGAQDPGDPANNVDGPNQRVFDVQVEGSTPEVFTAIDTWVEGDNGRNAFVLSHDVNVTDGELNLDFTPHADSKGVIINAIEIVYQASDDDQIDGGGGIDTLSYAENAGKVEVDLTAGTTQEFGVDAGSDQNNVVANDTLTGIENVVGSNFDDKITGTSGNNVLNGLGGSNMLAGGAGTDTWSTAGGSTGVTIDLNTWSTTSTSSQANSFGGTDTISGFVNAIGGEGDDIITGDNRDNVLTGRDGADTFVGGEGVDTVAFADGPLHVQVDLAHSNNDGQGAVGRWRDAFGNLDTVDRSSVEAYIGTSRADVMVGDGGNNLNTLYQATFYGADGNDTLLGSGAADELYGGNGADTISGLGGADTIHGGSGNDVLYGERDGELGGTSGAGNDTIRGEAGSDYIRPGAGNDDVDGGSSGNDVDIVSYVDNAGSVQLDLATGTAVEFAANGQRLYEDNLSNIEGAVGGTNDDVLGGDDQNNVFTGNLGNDTIYGGDGTDTVDYSARSTGINAQVSATGKNQVDSVSLFEEFVDNGGKPATPIEKDTLDSIEYVNGSQQADEIRGSSYGDTIGGLSGDDVLIGNGGDDVLAGGAGNDMLYGGTNGVVLRTNGHLPPPNGTNTIPAIDGGPDWIFERSYVTSGFPSGAGDNGNTVLLTQLDTSIVPAALFQNETWASTMTWNVPIPAGYYATDFYFAETANSPGGGAPPVRRVDVKVEGTKPGTLQNIDIYDAGGGDNGGDGRGAIVRSAPVVKVTDGALTVVFSANEENGKTNGFQVRGFNTGDADDDLLIGGAGDDTLFGDAGSDGLNGGNGYDIASYIHSRGRVEVSMSGNSGTGTVVEYGDVGSENENSVAGTDSLSGIEHVVGSLHDDTMLGDAAPNTFDGEEGDDVLTGAEGDDVLQGGAGHDSLDGGEGTDTAVYRNDTGRVAVDLAAGAASQYGAHGSDAADSIAFTDDLAGLENVIGTDFDDRLAGNDAANRLEGGAGEDWLMGGDGHDELVGGWGEDTVSYAQNTAGVVVNLGTGIGREFGLDGDASALAFTDRLDDVEHLIGSDFDDELHGDGGDNRLEGGAGDDTLHGGFGSDILHGGDGDDLIWTGGGRRDEVYGGDGADIFVFGDELANDEREATHLRDFDADADRIFLGDHELSHHRVTSDVLTFWAGDDRDMVVLHGVTSLENVFFADDALL